MKQFELGRRNLEREVTAGKKPEKHRAELCEKHFLSLWSKVTNGMF